MKLLKRMLQKMSEKYLNFMKIHEIFEFERKFTRIPH